MEWIAILSPLFPYNRKREETSNVAQSWQNYANDTKKRMCYTIIVPKWDRRDAASSEAAFCFAISQEGGSENGEKAR